MDTSKYYPKRGTVDIKGGLAALAQGFSAMGGLNVPYYTNYLEAQSKRQQMEYEAQKDAEARALEALKYQNTLGQQDITNQLSAQRNQLSEMNVLNTMGYKPTSLNSLQTPISGLKQGKIDRMNLLRGNIQAGPVTGGIYTPKPKESLNEYAMKQNMLLDRQIKLQDNIRNYKASEESPMSGDTSGRYAFADEAIRNIPKLKAVMFDSKGGFRQDIATKLMYPWKFPKDKEVQNAKRWIIGIATGRGLIQSGTVVKDNEWERIMNQLGIDAFSAPESILSSLDENNQFFIDFKTNIKPGLKGSKADKKDDPLGIL